MTMSLLGDHSLDLDPSDITIKRPINFSESSTIYEVQIYGERRVMKSRDYIDRVDPSAFAPPLTHFIHDQFQPRAVLLEYLPNAERLNCVNYSEALFQYTVDGIKKIHSALVHHHDIYPKNMLVVSGSRIVWIDFDVAMTFDDMGSREKEYCKYEADLVENLGEVLRNDQRESLPPNTKFY
ncbi:hypothetical protein BDV32DRAFT_138490 [Aspergillus pseudonomiae]|nr:hypothetical protein BDV32DRAFT_138490 [Aspergillus pseudonomiae]